MSKLPLSFKLAHKDVPADTSKSALGIELTNSKTGDIKAKGGGEFSKDPKVVTPLPVGVLVDKAYPAKSAGVYSTDAVFNSMIAGLSRDLTDRAGSAWESRLMEIADRIRNDDTSIVTLSDEAVRQIMTGIEMLGMKDISRAGSKPIRKEVKDSDTLEIIGEMSASLNGLDIDLDFDLD